LRGQTDRHSGKKGEDGEGKCPPKMLQRKLLTTTITRTTMCRVPIYEALHNTGTAHSFSDCCLGLEPNLQLSEEIC